jgi:hypothetical protein
MARRRVEPGNDETNKEGGTPTDAVTALAEAQSAAAASLLTGGEHHVAAGKALNAVRKRVRANKRRLSRR